MKNDKVIFKDFGKITSDTEIRDETLKAYICAILDSPSYDFDDIIKGIKNAREKEAFINMVIDDAKGRIERFYREKI